VRVPANWKDAEGLTDRAPEGFFISLPVALRLAQTSNFDVLQAREIVEQAEARYQRALAQILPTASAGATYVDHEGRIQQAVGNILNTNRNSLFVGGGPSLQVQLNEAIFGPLAARQLLTASRAGAQRVTNETLLAVAESYFNVRRARRRLARIDDTLDMLVSEQASPLRAGGKGLLPLVRSIVEVGGVQALRADVARVEVEVARRQEERRQAGQELKVAMAELARLLRLDPMTPLVPIEDLRQPLALAGEEWQAQPLVELVTAALNNRPEIAENQAVVRATLDRLRAAKWRALVPSVVLNYSAGGFGGSPNFVNRVPGSGLGIGSALTQSGRIDQFGSRSDFDVSLVWRLQNMGFGNLAEIREQRSIYDQANLRRLQVIDLVVAQVVQAEEFLRGGEDRLRIARGALFDAKGAPEGPVFLSVRLNFARIRGDEKTRALDVLDSIRGLNDVLESYAQSLTDYERARFRLLVALGLPVQALLAIPPQAE
jgi:outer membrane protein TolC